MAKYLFVIDCLGSGGAQRQLISIAKELHSKGDTVEFFIYYDHLMHFKPQLDELAIKVHLSHKHSRFSLSPIIALYRLLRRGRFQASLAFMQTPGIYLALAKFIGVVFQKPMPVTVFSERTTYEDSAQLALSFKCTQQLFRLHDHIVANSYHQKKKMVVAFPWMKSKLHTIYNGLDRATFNPNLIETKNESYQMICVSRVVQYKNYENLAKALVILKEQYQQSVEVTWIGKIFEDQENQTVFAEVKALLAKAGLEDSLLFVGERSDIATFYQHADALIHPSLIEGFSNVVMEATRYSLPLLLGNIGDHKWLLDKYPAGDIFDVHNPQDIANCIHRYLTKSEKQIQGYRDASQKACESLFIISESASAYKVLMDGDRNSDA